MEEYEINPTPNPIGDLKIIDIQKGETQYKCNIRTIKEFLQVSLYSDNKLKHQGSIHISQIQTYLGIYNYNIDEIFDEINLLKEDNFSIIKEMDKYKLKIEFEILRKKRYVYIDLIENENIILNQDVLIKTISQLTDIIKKKDNEIYSLREELNNYKTLYDKEDNSYDNFNIENKKPIHKLKSHSDSVLCSTVLKDGRFATGSEDNSIIIYNNKTFKPELKIKEHKSDVSCILQLSTGALVSCSYDQTIKIYYIYGNKYKVLQTLSHHKSYVNKIIELRNKKLVSCSCDKSIIFYNRDNNIEYKKDYSFNTNGDNGPIIQIKDNEICYQDYNNKSSICFYNLSERKTINVINNINIITCIYDSLLMLDKDLLLVTGFNEFSIIDVNSHNLIKTIDVSDSGSICVACLINKNILLTGDSNKRIIQWKIEGDNLKLISKKENAHEKDINTLLKLGDGMILSGSSDNFIKIW